MQFQLISEVQFSKVPGEHTPRPPSRLKKLFSPLCGDETFFKFDKTWADFGLDPRLDTMEGEGGGGGSGFLVLF